MATAPTPRSRSQARVSCRVTGSGVVWVAG